MCINPQHTIYSSTIQEVTAPKAHLGTTLGTQLVAQDPSFTIQLFQGPTYSPKQKYLSGNQQREHRPWLLNGLSYCVSHPPNSLTSS